MEEEIKAQGLSDLLKFADKEIIDKIIKIIQKIEVEEIDGNTRISIYLAGEK